MGELTHFDESGASRMVDVTGKEVTLRTARASGLVRMEPDDAGPGQDRRLAKGDVLEVARLAGIMAAKRTGELIPLCHPLGLDSVELRSTPVAARRDPDRGDREGARPHGRGDGSPDRGERRRTDGLRHVQGGRSGMVIGQIQLEEKTGGRRGTLSAGRRSDRMPGSASRAATGYRGSDRFAGPCESGGGVERRTGVETVWRGNLCSKPRTPGARWPTCSRPIRAELAEAERIFQHELRSRFPFVQHLVDHCGDYHGKRLRPALLLLSARRAAGHRRTPRAGGRGRDDPHRDAGPRRRARRADGPPPCRHGQRRLGQRDRRPAGRLPVHARLPPGGLARSTLACR